MRWAANLVGVVIMGAAMLGVLWVVYYVVISLGLDCIGVGAACAPRP